MQQTEIWNMRHRTMIINYCGRGGYYKKGSIDSKICQIKTEKVILKPVVGKC